MQVVLFLSYIYRRSFAVLCVIPTLNAFLPMLKYFLLLIAAFAIALAVAPYLRRVILRTYNSYARRWQALMKKWSLALGRYFIRQYKRLELKEPQADTSTVSGLGKLTPVRNASNIGLYETELSNKLEDPDVKNIAITGPYGSGKSSIIKTFFHLHPEYRPLYVSLAAFRDDGTINGKTEAVLALETEEPAITPEQQKILDDRIEYSILQQLFYHVRGKDVPFSRLKRIRTVKPSRIVGLALLVSLFVICVLYVYMPVWLPGYKTWNVNVPGWLYNLAILGIVTGAIYLIYLLFKFQQNASIIKLNLDKAQLEIAPDKGSSVLNQHMDEIVYYFGATSHDLLVIEDLDRFKNAEIFVKLREINTLINNSLQINRKVTFIYALRDDVFFDQNRTKFFDFILPVVPVTNASNSAANLINKFDSLDLAKPVSHDFLNDLSLFITDRRLIQNIFNEFQVYRHQLSNEALQTDMLLAMIVYKNIHPTDFNDLQSNKGMVYEFFQQKEKINAEMAKEAEANLVKWENEMQRIETIHVKSIQELKMIYVGALYKAIYKELSSQFTGKIRVGGNYLNMNEIMEGDVYSKLRSESVIQVTINNNATQQCHIKLSDIEREIDPNESFDERVMKFNAIKDADVLTLKREIKQGHDEIRQIRGQSIKELLARRKLFTFETPLNQHKALAYLVGNGYISEDYWLYVSYFEPGQLSKEDYQFILAVKNRIALEPGHELTRVDQVVLRLNTSDCLLPEVLNYDLLRALLRLKNMHPGKLAGIVKQLSKLYDEQWQFMDGFENTYDEPAKELIGELIKITPNFYTIIKKRFYDSVPERYLEAIIKYGDIESVVTLNEGNVFAEDIGNSPMVLENGLDNSVEKVTALINRLNIKFKYPPFRSLVGKGGVLKYIYDKHHYALNREMVDFMLKYRLAVQDIDAYNSAQLTRILAIPHEPISVYVQSNLETYLNEVFIQLPANKDEAQETISFLLKNKKLSDATKTAVIEKGSFLIEDLEKMPVAYLEPLFQNRRFKATWSNIYRFRLNNRGMGFSNELVEFLKRDGALKELSMDNTDSESHRSLLIELLENKNLDIDSKIALLNTTKVPLKIASFERIEASVIAEMEKRNLLQQDTNTFKLLVKVNLPTFIRQFNKHIDIDKAPALLKALDLDYTASYHLLQSINSNPEMSEAIYTATNEKTRIELLINDRHIPATVLEQFKLSAEQFQELADKMRYERSVIGILKANKELLTEELVRKFIRPLTDHYFRISHRQLKVVPKSDDMLAFLELLKETNILVKKYEVKNNEIAVVYLN